MMEPLSISPEEVNERLRALLHPDALATDNAPSPVPSKSAKAGGNLGAWASLGVDPSAPSRAQRWRHALAWLAAAGLALALPVQWAWTERAVLRAKSPTFDTAMLRLCPRCTNEPWRHLEGLSVSASSLQPTPQGGAYQLSLTLRNRAAHTLAMPWVELRLSDNKGRPVLRRAISPQELGAKSDRLGGNGTVNLQGSFSLRQGEAINGYEIGLFHP